MALNAHARRIRTEIILQIRSFFLRHIKENVGGCFFYLSTLYMYLIGHVVMVSICAVVGFTLGHIV